MGNRVDEIWNAIFAYEDIEATNEYLGRGRAFASMTVEALNRAWVAAYTAAALGSDARVKEFLDLEAELGLRALGPPHHLIRGDVMAVLHRRMAASSPEEIESCMQRARHVWRQLRKEAARPN